MGDLPSTTHRLSFSPFVSIFVSFPYKCLVSVFASQQHRLRFLLFVSIFSSFFFIFFVFIFDSQHLTALEFASVSRGQSNFKEICLNGVRAFLHLGVTALRRFASSRHCVRVLWRCSSVTIQRDYLVASWCNGNLALPHYFLFASWL